ncbi:putative leucine-rich repeat-containing protein DDB_G0281931 [Montipora capricornis]|uniref:putative leucine-rich repeat-containing protein DDB_G0281931 n=1 Tax=Montipora capricornis TaxID=246305 RepID=UPI0035F1DB66
MWKKPALLTWHQLEMWMIALLCVIFCHSPMVVQAKSVKVSTQWPRDTYNHNVFLSAEGPDCLKRINQFPLFNLDTSFTPQQEREVLIDIYVSTNGQKWYERRGWISSANNTSHCSWYGITCHGNTTHIKTIVLAYNNLNGFLPSNIWKIRNLFSLCTPGNPSLRGPISDFLFANMSNLLTVVFNDASISGNIPEGIVKMKNLQNFLGCVMNGDGFTGHLPQDIGNMTELRVLCLGGNNLIGQIPKSISRLKKLRYLDLRITPGHMHGNLSDIFAIPNVTELFISGVKLTGTLPRVLPERLAHLVLPGNSISGNISNWKNFPSILNLANNQLKGDIPGDVLLKAADMIDLSQNDFESINEGKAWPDTARASSASYVSLAGNRKLAINFSSFMELFSKKGNFVDSPSILNVSFCDITSPLLANVLYMGRLSTCDLSNNNFYGALPKFFTDFSLLTYFDVSSNNLTGSLPAGIQNMVSLQYLDISGNPSMRVGTSASSNVFKPDFLTMFKPPQAVNYTCPEGRLTFNNGRIRLDPTFYEYKYCVCDEGFYGGDGLCKKCMSGATCHRLAISAADDLRPNIMEVSGGYWPSPDPSNATHLVKCSVPSACNPTDSCTCRLVTTPKDTNSSSGSRQSLSSLITTCNHSCVCHPGNTDRFCSRCQEGFYKLGGLCFKCKKGNLTYYYIFIPIFTLSFLIPLWMYFHFYLRPIKWFVVTAIHFLLMLIMMLLELLPAWLFKLNLVVFVLCMSNRGKAARSLISITVFYIQTMDFMVSSVNVWPKRVIKAQSYLSSYWNLYFPSLSCDLPSLFTPVGKFAFLLLLPAVCLAMVGVYFITMLIYNRFRPAERRMQLVHFKCRQIAFFCLSFSYFPIVKQSLSILRPCHSDQDVRYMPNSPWIECPSHSYSKLKALGVVSVVFYVIGFPLIVIFVLIRFFPQRRSMTPEEQEKLDVWLGPVYLPYKPKYRQYFEIFMLFRRLVLAIALSMISSSSTLQTFVVWLVLMTSAIIHLCLQPYDEVSINRCDPCEHKTNRKVIFERIFRENVFEPLVLLVLSMSFMVLRFSVLDSTYANIFVWLVMVINTCVLVTLLAGIVYRLVGKNEGRKNGSNNCSGENSYKSCPNAMDSDESSDEEQRYLLAVNG